MTTHERFWSKVEITNPDGCWVWMGFKSRNGYGRFTVSGHTVAAHRWAYEESLGPIPEGLSLDHLCRNRACVKPTHLEPVTIRENVLRGEGVAARAAAKTHCPQGHPYEGANLMITKEGYRRCLTCHQERNRKFYWTDPQRFRDYANRRWQRIAALEEKPAE